MYHSLWKSLSFDRHLGSLHFILWQASGYLVQTFVYTFFKRLFFRDKWSRAYLLNHGISTFLVMERTAKLCHCQGECCNILHSHQPGRGGCFFASLPAFGVAAFFFFLMLAILIGVYYYLIVVLICVSLLGNNIEYISFYFETSLFPKLF